MIDQNFSFKARRVRLLAISLLISLLPLTLPAELSGKSDLISTSASRDGPWSNRFGTSGPLQGRFAIERQAVEGTKARGIKQLKGKIMAGARDLKARLLHKSGQRQEKRLSDVPTAKGTQPTIVNSKPESVALRREPSFSDRVQRAASFRRGLQAKLAAESGSTTQISVLPKSVIEAAGTNPTRMGARFPRENNTKLARLNAFNRPRTNDYSQLLGEADSATYNPQPYSLPSTSLGGGEQSDVDAKQQVLTELPRGQKDLHEDKRSYDSLTAQASADKMVMRAVTSTPALEKSSLLLVNHGSQVEDLNETIWLKESSDPRNDQPCSQLLANWDHVTEATATQVKSSLETQSPDAAEENSKSLPSVKQAVPRNQDLDLTTESDVGLLFGQVTRLVNETAGETLTYDESPSSIMAEQFCDSSGSDCSGEGHPHRPRSASSQLGIEPEKTRETAKQGSHTTDAFALEDINQSEGEAEGDEIGEIGEYYSLPSKSTVDEVATDRDYDSDGGFTSEFIESYQQVESKNKTSKFISKSKAKKLRKQQIKMTKKKRNGAKAKKLHKQRKSTILPDNRSILESDQQPY